MLEVVDTSQATRRLLRSPADGTAYGKAYTRPDLPLIVAMAARLEPPAEDEAYYLWLTTDGVERLAGVLRVNAEGFGLLVVDADALSPTFEAARVTLQRPPADTQRAASSSGALAPSGWQGSSSHSRAY